LWNVTIGPDGIEGGMMWGSAATDDIIFGGNSNSRTQNHTLINGQNISWGSWSAINRSNGKILWQTPDPYQSLAKGVITVANDTMFVAGAMAPDNMSHYYIMEINTGTILWNFTTTLTNNLAWSGAAIVDGTVYWGSDKLYAFELSV